MKRPSDFPHDADRPKLLERQVIKVTRELFYGTGRKFYQRLSISRGPNQAPLKPIDLRYNMLPGNRKKFSTGSTTMPRDVSLSDGKEKNPDMILRGKLARNSRNARGLGLEFPQKHCPLFASVFDVFLGFMTFFASGFDVLFIILVFVCINYRCIYFICLWFWCI